MYLSVDIVTNGWIVTDSDGNSAVFTDPAEMLQEVKLLALDSDDRHSEDRVYIIKHPGDKHSEFMQPHCPFCNRE